MTMLANPNAAGPARLFWDKGGIWSLMAWEACLAAGLSIAPITAEEIAQGGLADAGLLMVPGGWPSLKYEALGSSGLRAVVDFVASGGKYLGLCGGAGLALNVPQGLQLVKARRNSGPERLASISGPVYISPSAEGKGSPLWAGIPRPALFHVWWPGEFAVGSESNAQTLAVYQGTGPGFCTADLVADEIERAEWAALEMAYGMKLEPASLVGLPAVITATHGCGEAVLSYLHFDTPGDANGARVLQNLWLLWLHTEPVTTPLTRDAVLLFQERPDCASANRARDLWLHGKELGLWQARHPAMPLWRRGARGLEFFTLLRLTRALCHLGKTEGVLSREVESALEPIWRDGEAVLRAQGARISGKPSDPADQAREKKWFPRPRRVAGDLAVALATLENALLRLIRRRQDCDRAHTMGTGRNPLSIK